MGMYADAYCIEERVVVTVGHSEHDAMNARCVREPMSDQHRGVRSRGSGIISEKIVKD